jgi:O-antigen/teichoic acid export membrane protein
MALPIFAIPITLNYLGTEIYGLWLTVSSFVGMFVFADLGLGNGLLTALSRATGQVDIKAQQRVISTTAFMLTGIALVLGMVFFAVLPFLPWMAILDAKTPAAGSVVQGFVAAIAFCFLINLPLSTVQRSQMALQEGYQTSLWQCLGSICGIAVLLIGVKVKLAPTLLVLAISGMPLLITGLNWISFFYLAQPELRPRLEHFCLQEGKLLIGVGICFLIISVLTGLGMQADSFIIAHLCSLKAVTIYSVPSRMAMILSAMINMICAPMWVANGEAIVRGDVDWVRQNTARLIKASVLFTSIAATSLVVIGPPVLHIWLGDGFAVSRWLFVGLGGGAILLSASAPSFMVLNAAGIVSPQIKVFLFFTPVVLLAKIAAAKLFGFTAIPFANALCYGVIVLPAATILCREILRRDAPGPITAKLARTPP